MIMSFGCLLGVVLGFRATRRDEGLNHPIRRRLLELVGSRLAINEVCLEKEIGLKRGAVRYHLNFMVKHGLLRQRRVGRETHYFPPGVDSKRMDQFAAANHGRAHSVLREIFRDPGIPQWELAERVGMTRKILRRYLDLLAEQGLIAERREMRAKCYYPGSGLDHHLRKQVMMGNCEPEFPTSGDRLARRPSAPR